MAKPDARCSGSAGLGRGNGLASTASRLNTPQHDPLPHHAARPAPLQIPEDAFRTRRASIGVYAALVGTFALLAVAFLWVTPASALPSFSGQTGLPCSACHVGGFGPQLTPFGIDFRANGYTQRGGTGFWADFPVNLLLTPAVTNLGSDLPTPPTGYGTNGFTTLGCCTFFLAGGTPFGADKSWGIGGLAQAAVTAFVPGVPASGSWATSDFKLTKTLNLGENKDHPLVLGFIFTNTPTGGDPYNTLYDGYAFPYVTPTNAPVPAASPAIAVLGTSVYGMSVYGFYDKSLYVEGGVYETWWTDFLTGVNDAPSSLGTIAGGAPYFRIADQHSWGDNFLEVGGVAMYVPLEQIPTAIDPSFGNQYVDWGLDVTYQRALGPNTLAITGNILLEQQTLGASFASGTSANPSDTLDQFRINAAYYWQNTYGITVGYIGTFGSTDTTLYAPTPVTGSLNGSPNSQAIIAQIDWTPFGNDTTHWGFPWLNVRIGLQYTWYLQFNGGTTNYDGFGRNASDNNSLLLFSWFAF